MNYTGGELKNMTGRKKKELPENALVQKSRPLFSLWRQNLTLFEYKTLDLYLACINSKHPNKRLITFTKAQFEEIMECKGTHTDVIDARLKALGRNIDIDVGTKYKVHTNLFSTSYINTSTEPYTVELEIPEKMMQFVFEIDKENGNGYFSYRLRNTLKIESLYSYILFNYLEYMAIRTKGQISTTSWVVGLEELKDILNCSDIEYYSTFKNFNSMVLKRCHKELTEKTEIKFNYETIKQGRYVTAIRFTVEPLKIVPQFDMISDEIQPNILETTFVQDDIHSTVSDSIIQEDDEKNADMDERLSLFSDCFDNTFSKLQIQVLLSLVEPLNLPENPYGKDIAMYEYFNKMYRKLLLEESNREIKNRFKYFEAMIKNDNTKVGDV